MGPGPLLALLLVATLIVACGPEAPTCATPYIRNGPSCCLDKDADGACDSADAQADVDEIPTSCELCPPRFVTQKEEVLVYRYVCENGSIMSDPGRCGASIMSDAHLFQRHDEQDASIIKSFSARPACRGEYTTAEIHIAMERAPARISFEAKEDPEGDFRTIGTMNGSRETLDDEYFYIGLCTTIECATITDAQVPPEGAFLVRATLFYNEESTTTKDLLIDPTPEGEYGKKRC